jgi:asparagine synthase (glutamine-hydrolysing)
MKQDQMSMATSIESRVPYLDHVLVEHAMRLPSHLKLRGARTKAVLRAALDGVVPREVLTRKKMGFPVPLAGWLRGPFRRVCEELVLGERARARGLFHVPTLQALCAEHGAGARDHTDRLFLLMGLELWQRMFLDGEDHSAISLAMTNGRQSQ